MINTSQRILNYLNQKKQASANELTEFLGISQRAVFKQLKKLYDKGEIDKIGRPPKVFYFIKTKAKPEAKIILPFKLKEIINKNYFLITPTGQKKEGVDGFAYWCRKNNLPIEKTAWAYLKTWQKYSIYKKAGFIDGTYKFKKTFSELFINKIYYLDFYSIERFGKTKLGWLLLYAKQSQDRMLIKELVVGLKNKFSRLLKKYSIEAVGFIPPTIKREVQLMTELKKNLNLNLPHLLIQKVKTPVIVAQKTLSKLDDRIENAHNTILVSDNRIFRNILLIDDAVGSGATMNETAKKIKERNICQGKIYGLAITGSFKGFEIISEI